MPSRRSNLASAASFGGGTSMGGSQSSGGAGKLVDEQSVASLASRYARAKGAGFGPGLVPGYEHLAGGAGGSPLSSPGRPGMNDPGSQLRGITESGGYGPVQGSGGNSERGTGSILASLIGGSPTESGGLRGNITPVRGGGIMVNENFGSKALERAAEQAGRAELAYLKGSGALNMGAGVNVGGQAAAAQAAKAGEVTGFALTQEALGLQKQLEGLTKLSNEIRKLGISPDVIRSAEKNLLNLAAGKGQHLDNKSFKQSIDFVEQQMARRLSPHGYAPGEHAYGDNTIAQTVGMMTGDWTRWWADHNRQILGLGNQIGSIGAQGVVSAGQLGAQLNPAGLAASGIAAVGQTALDPNTAYQWWANQNMTDRFPELSGLLT